MELAKTRELQQNPCSGRAAKGKGELLLEIPHTVNLGLGLGKLKLALGAGGVHPDLPKGWRAHVVVPSPALWSYPFFPPSAFVELF